MKPPGLQSGISSISVGNANGGGISSTPFILRRIVMIITTNNMDRLGSATVALLSKIVSDPDTSGLQLTPPRAGLTRTVDFFLLVVFRNQVKVMYKSAVHAGLVNLFNDAGL